jgi:hypothetical protein
MQSQISFRPLWHSYGLLFKQKSIRPDLILLGIQKPNIQIPEPAPAAAFKIPSPFQLNFCPKTGTFPPSPPQQPLLKFQPTFRHKSSEPASAAALNFQISIPANILAHIFSNAPPDPYSSLPGDRT